MRLVRVVLHCALQVRAKERAAWLRTRVVLVNVEHVAGQHFQVRAGHPCEGLFPVLHNV